MTDSSGWCVYGDSSTDHKSSNRIKISQLVQELFHLSDLKPADVGGQRDGLGAWMDWWMCVGKWPMHACTHIF